MVPMHAVQLFYSYEYPGLAAQLAKSKRGPIGKVLLVRLAFFCLYSYMGGAAKQVCGTQSSISRRLDLRRG